MLTRQQLSELVQGILDSSGLVLGPNRDVDCSVEEVGDAIAEWLDLSGYIPCTREINQTNHSDWQATVRIDPAFPPQTLLLIPRREPFETDEDLAKRCVLVTGIGKPVNPDAA